MGKGLEALDNPKPEKSRTWMPQKILAVLAGDKIKGCLQTKFVKEKLASFNSHFGFSFLLYFTSTTDYFLTGNKVNG